MDNLINNVARALATPMPRRKLLRTLVRVAAGAVLFTLLPRDAEAVVNITVCGTRTTTSTPALTSSSGLTAGNCSGGTPDADLLDAAYGCTNSMCTVKTTSPPGTFTCSGGNSGNGNCGGGPNQCTVTPTALSFVKCACAGNSCGANRCCCTTNGTCPTSSGPAGTCQGANAC